MTVTARNGRRFTVPGAPPLEALRRYFAQDTRADPLAAVAAIHELYTALFGPAAAAAEDAIGLDDLAHVITAAYAHGVAPVSGGALLIAMPLASPRHN
jgi:hypothetical protein